MERQNFKLQSPRTATLHKLLMNPDTVTKDGHRYLSLTHLMASSVRVRCGRSNGPQITIHLTCNWGWESPAGCMGGREQHPEVRCWGWATLVTWGRRWPGALRRVKESPSLSNFPATHWLAPNPLCLSPSHTIF